MINFFITIIFFILLVTQKILLLNEESLILLCFIVFVNLGISKLGESFKSFLNIQSNEIKISLVDSLNKLLVIVKNFTFLSTKSKVFLEKIYGIKTYYKNWIYILSNYFLISNKYHLIQFYNKKLFFFNKIEEQTIKLLTTVIIKKLNLLIKTKSFYVNFIKLNSLLCTTTISIRECIQLIKTKKV